MKRQAAIIIVASALLGLLVDWRAPGLDRYARDWLMRERGPLAVPDDIAVVAIDEPSIARLGRFPWPRSLTAQVIDRLTAAQPKVIALDVLYSDPTSASEDNQLEQAIRHASNVVVAAQLVDPPVLGGQATWLLPLPGLASASASIGHVNVSTESDGVARQLLIREVDDQGHPIRAMAIEAMRIGDGIPEQSVMETPGAFLVGTRALPIDSAGATLMISQRQGQRDPTVFRPSRMAIDYIGPAGAFGPRTYSFSDVLSGRISADKFHGKYVLLGATANSLGDRLVSPFVHEQDVRGNQHGAFMPGVEVLANSLNTILRSRFYRETPAWMAFLMAAAVATLTLTLLSLAQGSFETVKQFGSLAGMGLAVMLTAYLEFTKFLIFPPIVSMLVAFGSAALLGLLRRSLITSAGLDASIVEVAKVDEEIAPLGAPNAAAETIARLARTPAAAIYGKSKAGRYRLVSQFGGSLTPHLKKNRVEMVDPGGQHDLMTIYFEEGMLALVHDGGKPPSSETVRVCEAVARGSLLTTTDNSEVSPSRLPRGVEWKARAIGHFNSRILDRVRFIHSALKSVEDGLLVARVDGRITFANRRAGEILGTFPAALVGRDLFDKLAEATGGAERLEERATLTRLLVDRAVLEQEVRMRQVRTRHFMMKMAAVSKGEEGNGAVLGIVVSLSEVTRQHELQQTKNDVMALVSHEMRTPLTAIQGMSELLAQFEVEPARRREMNQAINDEVKRLAKMIDVYLDVTRLESGRTVLRLAPLDLQVLLDRALLMLDPVAAGRGIRLVRAFEGNVQAVVGDADLLLRAINNLVSNAIKYSPPGTEVTVSMKTVHAFVWIEVTDHGYGIPEPDLEKIFEKFYRVPRVQDAGTSGTGLGLALVKEIAELHGGRIIVKSSPGGGSTFSLIIPESVPERVGE